MCPLKHVLIFTDGGCLGNPGPGGYGVVLQVTLGWAKRWRAKGWMRNPQEAARNADLWQRLLDLCDLHQVTFVWVKGHAGHRENERCDRLSVAAARGKNLPADEGYELPTSVDRRSF